jgi:hypothetical protein
MSNKYCEQIFLQQIIDDINTSFEPLTQELQNNLNVLEDFLGQKNTIIKKLTVEDVQNIS